MMGQIYRRCAQVRIWLGCDASNCGLKRPVTAIGNVKPRINPFALILHMAENLHFGEWPCFHRVDQDQSVYEDNDEFQNLWQGFLTID
jgi:hypothetical protein